MRIAIHDADAAHFKHGKTFPNYALMKISAWHKAKGDTVEWFTPIMAGAYDKVYSSKVFDFTAEDPYLPADAIRGGTGYGCYDELPAEIDAMFPDYSMYPECDFAIGFLTRGCPNKCKHCYVPQKEGDIRPYRTWQEVVRQDTNKLTLMDNNIIAHPHGVEQLRQLAETDYRLDINQAMSVFEVTDEIADILARLKWQKHIRFAVDRTPQIAPAHKVARMLSERGISTSRLFFYVLITDDLEDDLRRVYAMRDIPSATIYGMPYVDERRGIRPKHWQKVMAQKWIYSGQWRKIDWDDWRKDHEFYFKEIKNESEN